MEDIVEIVKWPDPVLETEAAPITAFDDELRARVQRMFELMYSARGVGLAAPQVGWSARLFIVNPTGSADEPDEEHVFVNPELVRKRGRELGEEGCLSFPGLTVSVARATHVVMRYQDLDGQQHEVEADDYVARILQHEYDHLLGVLFITRMTPADRKSVDVQKQLREFREQKDGQATKA